MELKEAIDKFKADLASVKGDGKDSVEIARLENYLDLLGSRATESAVHRQHVHEAKLAEYHTDVAYGLENFRIVTAAGKDTLNAIILVNGGAAIALMAFLGNLLAHNAAKLVEALALPALLLGSGVFCGGAGFGFRYLSQFFYADPKTRRVGHAFNSAAWVVSIAALCGFAWAMWAIFTALVHAQKL